MELKLLLCVQLAQGVGSLNRTILELKQHYGAHEAKDPDALNRTIVELKLNNTNVMTTHWSTL